MKKIHNILINRTDALGDTILSMPIAQLLKEYIPHCNITFIVQKNSQELFANYPYVQQTLIWDPLLTFFEKYKLWRQFYKKTKFDTYIYIGGDHSLSFFTWLHRVPNRAGLKSRWPSFLWLNMGLRQKRSHVDMHEIEYNLALLRPFGIFTKEKMAPVLVVSPVEIAHVKTVIPTTKPYFVIHPGMSGHSLNWSAAQYAHLVLFLEKKYPGKYEYVISYTPKDAEILKLFKDEIKQKVEKSAKIKILYFDGSLFSLRVFMALLSESILYIGGSTGPTHLANALGCFIYCIYSPIKVQSALRWGPVGDPTRVSINVPHAICGETLRCAGEKCLYFYCMSHMDVQSATEEIEKLLAARKKLKG